MDRISLWKSAQGSASNLKRGLLTEYVNPETSSLTHLSKSSHARIFFSVNYLVIPWI